MSYEQYVRHSRNHRKDRFVQQCSGYGGAGEGQQMTDAEFDSLGLKSFLMVVDEARGVDFPIYVAESGGYYHLASASHFSAVEVGSFEDLLVLGEDYVKGFDRSLVEGQSVESLINKAEAKSAPDSGRTKTDLEIGM